jgi:hypothetical protein
MEPSRRKSKNRVTIELLENKESLQKLTQTSTLKAKFIFQFYQTLLNLRNGPMFQNLLGLYDFILMRNKELVNDNEIKIKSYLTGELDFITRNLNNITKIYQNYIEDAVRQEYSTVELSDVTKKFAVRRDSTNPMSLPDLMSTISGLPMLKPNPRLARRKATDPLTAITNPSHTKYDFKILKLNTEGQHVFYNLLAGDEIATKDYQKLKVRVILFLVFEAFISNFHFICYFLMILYTFINGGINGFIFSALLILFVIVEEHLPRMIFWKLCFFNSVFGFTMKIVLKSLVERMGDGVGGAKIFSSNSTIEFIAIIRNIGIGSTAYDYEIVLLVVLLIQLIFVDELGFKVKHMIDFEDTNMAYIRMKINKVFNMREKDRFKTYELYLTALYESIKNVEGMEDKRSKMIRSTNRKNPVNLNLASSELEVEKDEISITDVIAYEEEQNNKKLNLFMATIKKIERYIFIKSFGKFSEENKKSFRWNIFNVYVRPSNEVKEAGNRLLTFAQLHPRCHYDLRNGPHRQDERRHAELH